MPSVSPSSRKMRWSAPQTESRPCSSAAIAMARRVVQPPVSLSASGSINPIFMRTMLAASVPALRYRSGMTDTLPLDGIRVVDLSRVLAGPFATMLLGDLGADVIKVEPPGGDETRGWGPPWWGDASDRRSAYFASVNRNKRSVVLDLCAADGRRDLDRLLATADLLVHN